MHAAYVCDEIPDELLGTWEFVDLAADGAPLEPDDVALVAVVDPHLRSSFAIDRASHRLGDTLVLTAVLTEDGRAPANPAVVWADLVRSPQKSAVDRIAGGPPPAVRSLPRPTRIHLLDDGRGFDARAGDGLYTGSFSDTALEGSYTFRFEARGATRTGARFARTATLSEYVRFAADPGATRVEAKRLPTTSEKQEARWRVRVEIRGSRGVLPRNAAAGELRAWASGGIVSEPRSVGDGVYTFDLVSAKGGTARLFVAHRDVLVLAGVKTGDCP